MGGFLQYFSHRNAGDFIGDEVVSANRRISENEAAWEDLHDRGADPGVCCGLFPMVISVGGVTGREGEEEGGNEEKGF
jgi:hypothetical protein